MKILLTGDNLARDITNGPMAENWESLLSAAFTLTRVLVDFCLFLVAIFTLMFL